MKVLIVMNGWLTKISGGDYHILRVAQYWSEKGVEVYYLIPELGYRYKYVQNRLAGKAFVIHTPFEKETNNTLKITILYLYRVLKAVFLKHKDKIDIVIASSHFLYDVIPAIILSKRHRSKIAVYIHHIILGSRHVLTFRNIVSLLNESISLWLIRRFADLVLVVNPNVKKDLLSKKFKPNKICVTSNGIEIEYITSIKSDFIKYDCCFCGRLVAQKGIFDLLDIWKKVIEVFPEAKLAIIGDGPKRSILSKRIKENKLDKNVLLLGFLDEYDKIKILKSSKIFLLPSYEEGWGIVIGEAMAAGVPVICYDLSEIKPIWKDKVVWVSKGDKKKFAKKVIELLSDVHIRRKYSHKCIKFVKKYSWDKIAEKELMMYRRILND